MTSSTTTSPITARAREFVAEHLPQAVQLGRDLGRIIEDPEAFVASIEKGFAALSDPDYRAAQAWIAPGIGPVLGVRAPLAAAVSRGVRRALREAPPAYSLYLGERLIRSDYQEVRLFAHIAIERVLPQDPERSWQLVRRLARRASDWDSVDHLAEVASRGILLEPYRWAEVEQLVYSPHRWERRLVASTVATIPFAVPRAKRGELARAPGLSLVRSLIGDADPDVQKALSWALRSWTRVDPAGVHRLLREEASLAARTGDGHRAWVIRDALSAVPDALAGELRATLDGLRRRSDSPATSRAAEAARAFAELPDAHALAEAPLSR